ncbi:hypothetical protein ACFFV7_12810 [Nonomuraea spiralis]|uniref:Uncharacterized protein n=1 Tax=Nonomuraea spiralis TaxID=46182 RepID=A0ABV5ICM7_9ACTN|nr:hypothetical protein [Nonomuraea spiralis]GGS79155.1 hypothetical protein GCM10010176_023000 [Nonomuraea spiralis]
MTTPPPQPPPQGPWGPQHQGRQPPPPPPPSGRDSTLVLIATLVAGLFAYSAVNVIVFFAVLFAALDGADKALVIGAAVLLAVVGLGGGLGFGLVRRPWSRGLGLGLAIGWALWSMLSAGVCTGLNPSMYG